MSKKIPKDLTFRRSQVLLDRPLVFMVAGVSFLVVMTMELGPQELQQGNPILAAFIYGTVALFCLGVFVALKRRFEREDSDRASLERAARALNTDGPERKPLGPKLN